MSAQVSIDVNTHHTPREPIWLTVYPEKKSWDGDATAKMTVVQARLLAQELLRIAAEVAGATDADGVGRDGC